MQQHRCCMSCLALKLRDTRTALLNLLPLQACTNTIMAHFVGLLFRCGRLKLARPGSPCLHTRLAAWQPVHPRSCTCASALPPGVLVRSQASSTVCGTAPSAN
jgi:hypothetical protein